MIWFENDFIDFHGELKCAKCQSIISYASTAKKKFVDWKPGDNRKICIDCVKKNVDDIRECEARLAQTTIHGKEKYVYYDGKLAI